MRSKPLFIETLEPKPIKSVGPGTVPGRGSIVYGVYNPKMTVTADGQRRTVPQDTGLRFYPPIKPRGTV
jgi:hypothetical protein